MNLKDKLFQMRNDQPYLNPVGIHIPEFEKLWDADKSEEKIKYAQALAYIYHMWEYDSPYYDRKNKEEEIVKDFIGKKSWKPTKGILAALEKYKHLDDSAEKRALDASTVTCDAIADDLARLRQDSKQLEVVISEIDREIQQCDDIHMKVELLKMKMDIQEQQLKISTALTKIMPQLEKTIETTINLRRKVTTSVYKGESSANTVKEFLYDKLMDELDYEQQQDTEDGE
jgi:hypothetical protein